MAVVTIRVGRIGKTGYQYCDLERPFRSSDFDFVVDMPTDDWKSRLLAEHVLAGLIRHRDNSLISIMEA